MEKIFERRYADLGVCRNDETFADAVSVLRRLREHGFGAYFVGGAVRDLLLGRKAADWDIVTTALPDDVMRIFPDAEMVGAGFGVSLVKTVSGSIEVATARRERFYMDGRHPEKVEYTADFACDTARRDFTINALLLDPDTGIVCDWHGGLKDIDRGVIEAIGDPAERFREDHLRMLRCIRFAAKLDFEIGDKTLSALKELAPLVKETASERIFCELDAMITGKGAGRAFRLLESTGILREILPEAADLRKVEQPPEYHPEGDVLEHTFIMLEHLTAPSSVLAWAVLFHDLGKKETFSRTETGRIHFFGHEQKSGVIAGKIMERLRFSRSDIRDIKYLIENHMRFGTVRAEAKLRRLEGDPLFAEALELNRLDALSSHRFFEQFLLYIDRRIAADGKTELPPPMVGGDDLIAAGFTPGVKFKKVLENVYEKQLENKFPDKTSAVKYAVKLLEER